MAFLLPRGPLQRYDYLLPITRNDSSPRNRRSESQTKDVMLATDRVMIRHVVLGHLDQRTWASEEAAIDHWE